MKKLLALILSLVLLISMTACGSSGGTKKTDDAAAAEKADAAADEKAETAADEKDDDAGEEKTDEAADADTSGFTPVVWRFANQTPENTLGNDADLKLCEDIETATEGRVKVELYNNQSLGDYMSIFDEVMIGTIEMAHISPVETYDSRVSGTMLPYLGGNYEELLKAYDPDGYLYGQVFEALDNIGIRLMGVFCEGYNGVSTTVPLENVKEVGADKGVVIRSPMMDVYSLNLIDMGFRVSSMPFSDVYTATQTGVVAGFAGVGSVGTYLSFRDLVKYYYDYHTCQEATLIMISKSAWDKLLPQDQEAIQDLVTVACEDSAGKVEEYEQYMMDQLEDAGIEVVRFTDEELNAYAESTRENVWPQLAKNYPEGFLDNVLASIEG